MRIAFATATLLLASGCASMILDGFVGKPVSAVVSQYGMPVGSYELGGGDRAFVWQKNSTYVVPGTTRTQGSVVGNQVFTSTYTSPGYTSSSSCVYILHAKRTRMDIDGPVAWTVTGYEKPRFDCE